MQVLLIGGQLLLQKANGLCFKQPVSQPALAVAHNLHIKSLSMRVPSFDSAECYLCL